MLSLIKGLSTRSTRAQPAGVGQVGRAVFWSFAGIRRRRDLEQDASAITPLQAIVAGVAGAALFVGLLLLTVRIILRFA